MTRLPSRAAAAALLAGGAFADGSLYVVANHLNLWVDGDMDFESPAVPNFSIWRIPGVGQSYTAE